MAGLTLLPFDPLLDLPPWVGQRQATFRFDMFNGVTGEQLGQIHPIRNASMSHDTTRTIKRQMSLDLGVYDTETIDTITARIRPFMVFPNGQEFPLGTFMFTDASRQVFTSGKLASVTLNDEMFLVDQLISAGISGNTEGMGVNALIPRVLAGLPIEYDIESSPYGSSESWSIGTGRGSILEALSVTGDFFSPWFGNDSKLHFIRSFDPFTKIPDFDFDAGNQVQRAGVVESDNLLTAPNRFVVISNNSSNTALPVVGSASVPQTAPHSLANRGFEILDVQDLQVTNSSQAQAIANNMVNRLTVFQTVNLSTAPDPRHDSYNVIRWQGDLWLELAWSLAMTEGGGMNHLLRKAYRHE
jgi:hypothetical protein